MATSTNHQAQTPQKQTTISFSENLGLRRFILNRPEKLNTLNLDMLDQLEPVLAHWEQAELASVIVGSGSGRAFCAGGDVAAITTSLGTDEGKKRAIEFFQREFSLDYFLALLGTPYVAIMDGITFGGGFGLAAPATFRVATERTMIAMPETKIGYFPDVGASYYLSRLDGEIGTYLALTGEAVKGRTAFELGLATHYVPSSRIPLLLDRMAALEDPTFEQVAYSIDELHGEREPTDAPPQYTGALRSALDATFSRNSVEEIVDRLGRLASGTASESNTDIVQWAKSTLAAIEDRSPTSLRIALKAIRKGKNMSLSEAFHMELGLVSVFCGGAAPDFTTGVSAVLKEKLKTRPVWSPATLAEVSDSDIEQKFFQVKLEDVPQLIVPEFAVDREPEDPMVYALPTEDHIMRLVKGETKESADSALTVDELLDAVDHATNNKPGAREKVLEVIDRKCALDGDEFLRWK